MKKLIAALCCTCALVLAANAGDEGAKKPELTEEQKALKTAMIGKYDANKDGKLDKDEKAKFSAEDKAKWDQAFPKKKEKKAE